MRLCVSETVIVSDSSEEYRNLNNGGELQLEVVEDDELQLL